jgi:hypothetical protein
MKLLLENLPPSLQDQRETLARCLEAMDRALPLKAVYLFGSHARGLSSRKEYCLPRKTEANNPADLLWFAVTTS